MTRCSARTNPGGPAASLTIRRERRVVRRQLILAIPRRAVEPTGQSHPTSRDQQPSGYLERVSEVPPSPLVSRSTSRFAWRWHRSVRSLSRSPRPTPRGTGPRKISSNRSLARGTDCPRAWTRRLIDRQRRCRGCNTRSTPAGPRPRCCGPPSSLAALRTRRPDT